MPSALQGTRCPGNPAEVRLHECAQAHVSCRNAGQQPCRLTWQDVHARAARRAAAHGRHKALHCMQSKIWGVCTLRAMQTGRDQHNMRMQLPLTGCALAFRVLVLWAHRGNHTKCAEPAARKGAPG